MQRADEHFLPTALGRENHPAPPVINTDKHAAYPPAIVELKADGVLEEKCTHRPVQYLNSVLELGTGSPGHLTPGACKPAFSLLLGSLAHDDKLDGNHALHP
jgi:DDE domain